MSLAEDWRGARPAPAGVHVDSAACSRQSTAVLEATATHARHEAETGGYVVAEAAAPALKAGRVAIGALTGFASDDVVFTTGATDGLDLLLDEWSGARTIACVPGEFGPSLAAMYRRGFEIRPLPVDADGKLDPDATASALAADPPGLVHLTPLSSHRGVVHPVDPVSVACRANGIALIVDVAQAFAHLECTDIDADAVYGTSRKWLAGPRGVGFVATRPGWLGEQTLLRLAHREANVAARVGFAVALGEHLAAGPPRVHARLREVGALTRTALAEVPGWRVVEAEEEPSAITTLTPPDGVDPAEVRARLIAEHGVVTTYLGVERAPLEMTAPALRVSPHVDVTNDDLDVLVAALAATGSA